MPIETEVYTPGSPIISPADVTGDDVDPIAAVLPQRDSVLSATAGDDDEAEDEVPEVPSDGVQRTIPTKIEWKGEGKKVYVTGTFAGWNKKYRLNRR